MAENRNIKIVNGRLLLEEAGGYVVRDADLYVKNGRISFQPFADGEPFETFDAKDRLVMPGLINMHTHVYMTLMRGYADDVDFGTWLFERVMPVEDSLPTPVAYWTSLLGCMEMIRTGTTCFVDMHMYHRQSPAAARDAGMRARIGRGLVGEDLFGDGYSRFSEALEEKEAFASDTIGFVLSPHAIYTGSPKLLSQVAEKAKELGMLKQIHLSESVTEVNNCLAKYGKTPPRLLYDLGFLDEKTILAHCVHLQGDDLDLIAQSGATIVTNPASNAKLGNGFAPVEQMLKAGVNVCIGTDGAASNNTLNMFREMGLLSLIHKGINNSSTALPAKTVVRMATANAGKALQKPGELGVISEDAAADLIFLDLRSPSLFPNNDPVSSLCYSANGSEVDSVMIDGKWIMKKGQILTIDVERVYYEVAKAAEQYLK